MLIAVKRLLIMLFVCCVGQSLVYANHLTSIETSKINDFVTISEYLYIDNQTIQTNDISVNNLLTQPHPIWRKIHNNTGILSLSEGENWFAINLHNSTEEMQSVVLVMPNKFDFSNADLYILNKNKQFKRIDFPLKPINVRAGEINLGAYETKSIYLKISSDSNSLISLYLYNEDHFISFASKKFFVTGLGLGGLLFITLVMLLFFIASKDHTLGMLSGYLLSRSLMFSIISGVNLYYLSFEQNELRGLEFPIISAAAGMFFLAFSSSLFELKFIAPKIYRFNRQIIIVLGLYLPISLFLSVQINYACFVVLHVFITLYLAFVGFYLTKHGHRLALLFACTMVFQFIIGLVNITLPYFITSIGMLSSVLNLFSFGLSTVLTIIVISRQYYFNVEDKNQIQLEALENAVSSKQAQDELLELQKDNQLKLEESVQERTLELNIALQELEELNRELEEKNTLDELTGLFNRRFYDQRVLAEYRRSKRNISPLSLVLIDIDFFKKVNDTYGHLAGDECLRWLGHHIKAGLKRSTDVGCRYGGEEFCLILSETDTDGAIAIADEIRQMVEKDKFIYQNRHIPITISCGVSTYAQQVDVQPEHIFFAADKALYHAKHNGRNRVSKFDVSHQLSLQEAPHE